MKAKRSKACNISKQVKDNVWERDNHRCIFCGSSYAMPNAHYIPRSKGGLGIEQNIVTACIDCHRRMDQSTERSRYLSRARKYLKSQYEDWNEENLIYKKWGN